jgi:hypothetical protein
MNIKVSIPVTVGGYTGQRDAWEGLERDFVVSYDIDTDTLCLQDERSPTQTRIELPWPELQHALEVVGSLE